MDAKPPSASHVTISQVMLISDANPQGNVHGGTIMKLVDTAGALAALRHGRRRVVTVEMDSMRFHQPVHVGNLLTLSARVTAVWRSSLEAYVDVEAEDVLTGERRHTSSAFLVFVALDDDRGLRSYRRSCSRPRPTAPWRLPPRPAGSAASPSAPRAPSARSHLAGALQPRPEGALPTSAHRPAASGPCLLRPRRSPAPSPGAAAPVCL